MSRQDRIIGCPVQIGTNDGYCPSGIVITTAASAPEEVNLHIGATYCLVPLTANAYVALLATGESSVSSTTGLPLIANNHYYITPTQERHWLSVVGAGSGTLHVIRMLASYDQNID